MSPQPRFQGLLAAVCLLAAVPSPCYGQGGFPPGLEVQPPAPVPALPPTTPPPDLSGLGVPPPLEASRPVSPWYVAGEVAVLFTGAVHFNGEFAAVKRDNPAYLSPRIYIGRRLDGGGAVRFTYRNLTQVGRLGASEASSDDVSSDSTFTTNWFDLDYVSREYAPLSWWHVRWEAGGRFVFRYAGSSYQDSYARSDSSQNYFGGGPHFGLTSQLLLGQSGWAVYGRADTAVTFGGGVATSDYRPKQTNPWWGDSPRSDRASLSECQFDLGLQLGLVRRTEWRGRVVGFGAGVQADVLTVGNTRGKVDTFGLVNVGPFLRCEFGF